MTDREALDKAQKELDTSGYLAELTLNEVLQKVHQNRIAWLARVLRLARKALYIEEIQKQPKTNADRIRAMSDEELANIIAGTPICKERYMDCLKDGKDCEACLLEWLKQPAEEWLW